MCQAHPQRYLEGIRLFNERELFECHDVLEELWADVLGHERDFYQGLIQAAVALFHFGEGNLAGAHKLYHSSQRYLQRYGDFYRGVDLAKFRSDLQRCFHELLEADPRDGYPSHVNLREDTIPLISFSSEPSAT